MRRNANAPRGSVAAEHMDKMFAELDCATRIVRERCDPVRIAARHPVATAALSLGVGLLAARQMCKKASPQAAPEATPETPPAGGFPWKVLLRYALTVAPLLIPKTSKPPDSPAPAQPAESTASARRAVC